MTIYLDTNILPRWGSLSAPHIAALIAVARTAGHQLALPSLVIEESVNARRRDAIAAFELLSAAHKRAFRYSDAVTTYIPSGDDSAEEWRRELSDSFKAIDLPPAAAVEALRREAHRLPPARDGKGGRDVAIWLTVLQDATGSNGPSYFVSDNTHDFARPDNKDDPHPELAAEIAATGAELSYCPSLDSLFAKIAPRLELTVEAEELLQSAPVDGAIRQAVDIDVLPRLVVKRVDTGQLYEGDVYMTQPASIVSRTSKFLRAHDIDDHGYCFLMFDVEVWGMVGVFSRGRRYEVFLSLDVVINCHAWLVLAADMRSVADVDITRVQIRNVKSTDSGDKLMLNVGS